MINHKISTRPKASVFVVVWIKSGTVKIEADSAEEAQQFVQELAAEALLVTETDFTVEEPTELEPEWDG